MGHIPNEKPKENIMSNPSRLCSGIIFSRLTSSASRIYSHQQVDDHRKRRRTTYKTIKQTNRVRQSRNHTSSGHILLHNPSSTYIIQSCYDFSSNTLDSDSTHPDTYNLVRFSGCLHLWCISLLTPELSVISVTMFQSPHTRLALNEFQASCYSHHKSQSALSEITYSLEYQDATLP